MPVTMLYAGLLGALLVVLSARVIMTRRRDSVNLGHDGNPTLARRVRAQGNLIEYAPMILIMLGALEFSGLPAPVLHGLGLTLLAGRLLHGWALSFTTGSSFARVTGIALTLTVLGIATGLCLWMFAAN